MAILPFERITTLLAPACLWRQLSLPSVSRSNPCPACLTVAILYPARTSSGITRSITVGLPLMAFPTKQTIGTAIETFLSAARQPVRAGLTRLGLIRPGFAIEQLDGQSIARVRALRVGRYMNQTVRLDHGGENTGALIPRGAHLERAVLLCQHPSKKMPAISPFVELFLERRLHDWTAIAALSAHFEHRRTHHLFERDHGRDGIAWQSKGQLALDFPEGEGLSRLDGQFPEIHFGTEIAEHRLGEIVIAHRDAAREDQDIGGQAVRDLFLERRGCILCDAEQEGNAARILDRGGKPVAVRVDDLLLTEPLVEVC